MNTSENKKVSLCFIVLFLFAAVRYGVGYDYYSYLSYVTNERDESNYESVEPLSRLLMQLAIYTHYQLFFALGSLLTIYPVFIICKKYSINPVMSLLVFYLHPAFYLAFFSIVRNGIAISFVFYAIMMLQEKKLIKSVALIICACLFHKSALIGILIYPLFYFPSNKRLHLVAFVVSFGLSILMARMITQYGAAFELMGKAERYLNSDAKGGGLMTIIVNGLGVVNLYFWDKIKKCRCGYDKLLGMCNVGVCLWNIFLPLNITMAERFSLAFMTPIILIVPCYSQCFSLKIRMLVRRLTYLFFIALFCSHFYISIASFLKSPERMSSIPYQTVFFGEDYSNLQ